jgi:chromosome partitioning protein
VIPVARSAGKPAWLVFNAVPPGARRLIEDARAAIATHRIEAAPFVLSQRAVFVHALTAGQSAQEFEPNGRAVGEIAEIFSWLKKEIGL